MNENGQNESYNGEDYIYKKVMLDKRNSRAWSVASLSLSIFSLLCCCFVDWLGMILSALAIVFAIISRKNIGYFDGLSLAGLIVGIFGIVFGIASIILGQLMVNNEYFEEFLKEWENYLNENGGGEITPPEVPSGPVTPPSTGPEA